ncbi:MAG: hypothetical protein ABSF28_04305 [Terracidiphilus sp.]|jgi:hypothetical protein
MSKESIETIVKQTAKAVELLLKLEATRVAASVREVELDDEEDTATQLAGELRRMAADLHQAVEETN